MSMADLSGAAETAGMTWNGSCAARASVDAAHRFAEQAGEAPGGIVRQSV